MSFLSRSASIIAKSAISLVSLAGIAAVVAAPVSAQNASVSGAITRTTPAGFVTSISGEMVAPTGMYYEGPLVVTGVIEEPTTMEKGDSVVTGSGGTLTLSAGELTAVDSEADPSTLKAEVLSTLQELDVSDPVDLDAYSAILKAAAGTDGLE